MRLSANEGKVFRRMHESRYPIKTHIQSLVIWMCVFIGYKDSCMPWNANKKNYTFNNTINLLLIVTREIHSNYTAKWHNECIVCLSTFVHQQKHKHDSFAILGKLSQTIFSCKRLFWEHFPLAVYFHSSPFFGTWKRLTALLSAIVNLRLTTEL